MKKMLLAIIMLLLFTLSACHKQKQDIYQVEIVGDIYTIDTENRTITYDNQTYKYEIEGSKTIITYPDNTTYFWTRARNGGYGGYDGLNGSYDEEKYISGDKLLFALYKVNPVKEDSRNYVLIILLILLGAWNAISPYSSWYLSHGWKYKNVQPSEVSLIWIRIGGMISIGIGILLFF